MVRYALMRAGAAYDADNGTWVHDQTVYAYDIYDRAASEVIGGVDDALLGEKMVAALNKT